MAISRRNPKVSVKVSVRDIDRGFKQIIRDVSLLNGREVKAGVLLKDANKRNSVSGEMLGKIAVINEEGIGVPKRSFMGEPFDALHDKWFNQIRRYMQRQTIRKTFDRRALFFSGKLMQKSIVLAIKNKSEPRNADSTIKRKGRNDPLVHTKLLERSIKFETSGRDST